LFEENARYHLCVQCLYERYIYVDVEVFRHVIVENTTCFLHGGIGFQNCNGFGGCVDIFPPRTRHYDA